jgi:hypothetical protein
VRGQAVPNIDETNQAGQGEGEPFEGDPEEEAQRSSERRDNFEDEPTEKEIVVPPGEIVPPGEVIPTTDEKIVDAAEADRERIASGGGLPPDRY